MYHDAPDANLTQNLIEIHTAIIYILISCDYGDRNKLKNAHGQSHMCTNRVRQHPLGTRFAEKALKPYDNWDTAMYQRQLQLGLVLVGIGYPSKSGSNCPLFVLLAKKNLCGIYSDILSGILEGVRVQASSTAPGACDMARQEERVSGRVRHTFIQSRDPHLAGGESWLPSPIVRLSLDSLCSIFSPMKMDINTPTFTVHNSHIDRGEKKSPLKIKLICTNCLEAQFQLQVVDIYIYIHIFLHSYP